MRHIVFAKGILRVHSKLLGDKSYLVVLHKVVNAYLRPTCEKGFQGN